jgi:hypothetical protein
MNSLCAIYASFSICPLKLDGMKMNETQTRELEDFERDVFFGPHSDNRLGVTVLFTTEEGTLAALKAAAALAMDVPTRVTLAIPQVVPRQCTLEEPPVRVEFLERRALGLVSDSAIRGEAVTVRIWLCRNRNVCLERVPSTGSLIIIGGRWHGWFRDEWRLEKWLTRRGYHVIFADAAAKTHTGSIPKAPRDRVVYSAVRNLEIRGEAR